MGSQEGQLVSITNSDRSWALQLLMEMGLPLEEQPENVWANTRWAWTGLRKTHHNVGKVNKNSRYSAGDWQWADGIIPGQSYRILLFSCFNFNNYAHSLINSSQRFCVWLVVEIQLWFSAYLKIWIVKQCAIWKFWAINYTHCWH